MAEDYSHSVTRARLFARFRTFVLAALSVAALLALWPAIASAKVPALTRLHPAGGQRGTKVTVTCSGSFDWPVLVWAPGVQVEVDKEAGKLKIAIPPDLAADRIWLRLYNDEGVSDPFPFQIGGLTEIDEQEPNNAPRTALALLPNGWTINGVLDGVDVDAFAIPLAAGETLVAVVDSNLSLKPPMDAMLQVVSPDDVVVAENNDDVGLDPRITYTSSKAGTYVVRLFAFSSTPNTGIALRGGADFVYRLTLTTGPYMTHAVPLTVSEHETPSVTPGGWNIPEGTTLPVIPFGKGSLQGIEEFDPVADIRTTHDSHLGLTFAPNFGGSARVRIVPHTASPKIVSAKGNDPLALTLPTSVTGRLLAPRQVDKYRFPLRKGEQVVISAETRSLYFPFDAVLRLYDPTGALAAEYDSAAPARAASISHTTAHFGDYQLTVSDRTRRGGNRCYYRLTARCEEPDFELSTTVHSILVAADKPTEVTVNILRRAVGTEAVGPITIQAIDLPEGVTAAPVVSEPGTPTADKVTLSFQTNGAKFSGPIRIVGKTTQPREITRYARTTPLLGNCLEVFWLTALPKP